MSDLLFHIVYMPGSVRYLTPLVNTLLHWSSHAFCLVANGCGASERQALQRFCQSNVRLHYQRLPGETPSSHGAALNWLQARNRRPQYCFMDSDIFATGPFDFAQQPPEIGAVFSCTPLWRRPQESVMPPGSRRVHGRYSSSVDGRCLGVSYFAIYDSELLQLLAERDWLDFRSRQWAQLTPSLQAQMEAAGFAHQFYDSGKIVNLLLAVQKARLRFEAQPNLHHLGGFSRLRRDSLQTLPTRLRNSADLLARGRWSALIVRLAYWLRLERLRPLSRHLARSELLRQISVERYFSDLIVALVDGSPPPSVRPFGDRNLQLRIGATAAQLHGIYAGEVGKKDGPSLSDGP